MKRLLLFFSLAATCTVHAQTAVQFTGAYDNSWINSLNWSSVIYVPGSSSIAVFGSQPNGNGSNNGCSIDFGSVFTNNGYGNQVIGAVRVLSTRTRDMNIGNSTAQVDGTLTLSGVTINSTTNVVVDNLMEGYDLHFNNSIVGANRVMKLALGTNAVFNGATNSVTEIAIQVSSATNVTVNGGELQLRRSGGSTFPSATNFTVSSGTLHISSSQMLNNLDLASGTTLSVDDGVTLTINGTFTDRGATVSTSGTGKVIYGTSSTLNYAGTTSMSAGNEWPSATGPQNITISNTSGVTMTTGRTIAGTVTVNSTLNMGTYQLSAASLIVNNGGTVKVGSTSTSGALTGNFGTTSLTFNTGSTVEFNGSALQYVSSLTYPNLTVNNGSNGLSLLGNVTVSGVLTLNASTKLDLAGKALTLGGTITGTGTFKGSSASTLNIASASTVGTLNFDQATDGTTNALASLAVSSGGATLGGKLHLYTALNVSGGTLDLAAKNLVMKSTSAQTAYVAEIKGTLTGASNVTVERYSPAWSTRRYRLATSPVMGTTINAAWQESGKWNGLTSLSSTGYGTLITGQQQGSAANANANGFDYWSAIANSSASVRYYVQGETGKQGTWQPISSTLTPNAFDNHEAYLVFIRGDRATYSGTTAGITTVRGTGTLKKGNYTISVPYNKSYTLIGNPYASPIDMKLVYDDNSAKIEPSFYVWKASLGTGTGGYVLVRPVATGSSLYETIPGDGTQSAANRLVHSGEGFFVMPSTSATSGNSITIKESHKSITTPTVSVFRQVILPPAKLYVNLYAGEGENKTLLDGVLSEFKNPFTGVDTMLVLRSSGMEKSVNTGENLAIQQDAKDWIVATKTPPQANDTMRLHLWNTAAKTYQIEVKSVGFDALSITPILIDKYLRKSTVVQNEAGTVYSFAINADAASKDADRFFVVFKQTNTLPLSIASLRAEEKNGSVNVQWKVANEADILSYQVEKSQNGSDFSVLGIVRAKTATGEGNYTYLDSNPAVTNYYRIKLNGTNGETKYSFVVKVQLQTTGESISAYPNPVSGNLFSLQFTNKARGTYRVTLYNTVGQILLQKAVQHYGGSATEMISLGEGLSTGTYYVEVNDPSEKKTMLNLNVRRE